MSPIGKCVSSYLLGGDEQFKLTAQLHRGHHHACCHAACHIGSREEEGTQT